MLHHSDQASLLASHPRILVAEDDDELRSLITQTLQLRGFHVVELEDGLELTDYFLLAQAQKVPVPDLIVSDVCMPGKTGLDGIAQMRAAGWHCPVVVISAFAEEESRRRAFELGAALFFDKPVDLSLLSDTVTALLLGSNEMEPRRR